MYAQDLLIKLDLYFVVHMDYNERQPIEAWNVFLKILTDRPFFNLKLIWSDRRKFKCHRQLTTSDQSFHTLYIQQKASHTIHLYCLTTYAIYQNCCGWLLQFHRVFFKFIKPGNLMLDDTIKKVQPTMDFN